MSAERGSADPGALPLPQRLARQIEAGGPISIAHYMAEANAHYYGGRDPLGEDGDFTTAPEISQMFGELLGLWAADIWQKMGAPARCYLVELGPGRGTLMRDALRAARALPAFRAAIQPLLVEASERLRGAQRETLAEEAIAWHDDVDGPPKDAPLIVLANEFLDALPVRQFQRRFRGAVELGHLEDLGGKRADDADAGQGPRRARNGVAVEPGLVQVISDR